MTASLATRLRFRIALWLQARLLPWRMWRERPLSEVMALANTPRGIRYRGLPVAYVLDRVARATRRPILMRDRRCLRQGVLAQRFMAAAGHPCELRFGVERASLGDAIRAHCWLVHDGKPVLNPPGPATVLIFTHASGQ